MNGQERSQQTTRRDVLAGIGMGTLAVGTISLIPASAAAEDAGGKVAFVYDDSPREDYTKAFPAHQEYDVPGCAAVCPGLMGSSSEWLEPEHLEEMHEAGWEVMSHTLMHRALGEIPVRSDIEAGDTEIHVQSSLHGQYSGDPLVIFNDDTEVTATSAGRNDADGEAILAVEEPIEEDIEVDGEFHTWVRYTDEFTEGILEESKAQIEEWGFGPVSAYVHTYNRYDGYVTEVLPEYYESTPNRDGDPLNPTFELDPFACGRVNFEDDKMTEAELTELFDTVAEEPYFAIVYGHANYDTFTQERIETTIELCLERDLDVVTFQEILIDLDLYDPPDGPSDQPTGSDDDHADDGNGNQTPTDDSGTDTGSADDDATDTTTSSDDDSSFLGELVAAIIRFFRSLFDSISS